MSADTHNGIRGWAFDMLSDKSTQIDLLINGETVNRLTCREFLLGIAGWQPPRNGYIGFNYSTKKPAKGDQIEIRDTEAGLTLDRKTVD